VANRNGRGKLVRQALEEGPVTASELAAILELEGRAGMRICSAWLGWMRCKGQARVIGQRRVQTSRYGDGGRLSNIYALGGKP
jgi:hypothetical protein